MTGLMVYVQRKKFLLFVILSILGLFVSFYVYLGNLGVIRASIFSSRSDLLYHHDSAGSLNSDDLTGSKENKLAAATSFSTRSAPAKLGEVERILTPIYLKKLRGSKENRPAALINVSSRSAPAELSEVEKILMPIYLNKLRGLTINPDNIPVETCPAVLNSHGGPCFVEGCNSSFQSPALRLQRILRTQYPVETKYQVVIDGMTNQSDYADIVFVTAASSNHFDESEELVRDLHKSIFPRLQQQNEFSFRFFYYDLGLASDQVERLKKYCNCTVIKFPFQSLPSNFQKLRTCLWKPLIMKAHLRFSSLTFWMDACVRFKTNNITGIMQQARRVGIFLASNQFMLAQHVHPAMLDYFDVRPCQLTWLYEMAGGFIVLKNELFIHKAVLEPWVACTFSPKCACPSEDCMKFLLCRNRGYPYFWCHRYDQAALGIIIATLFDRQTSAIVHHLVRNSLVWFRFKREGVVSQYFPKV